MTSSLNLQEINQEQALNLAKFAIRSQTNLFFFGQRGLGKTAIIMQAAKELGFKVNYINLSVIERSDLAGYPDIQSTNDTVSFKSPYFLPKLIDNQKPDSILLFDEVDKAMPECTAPLLEILQFKKINGKPINVASCLLTGNLPEERTYSSAISTALLDRGSKYLLSFDFYKWIDWAKQNNVHPLILGFLKSDNQWACGKIDDLSYASPSPRSWTLASNAIIQAKEFNIVDIEEVSQIVCGYVGLEAGIRFKIWYEHYRQFEPYIEMLINQGKMSLKFDELIPSEQMIFVVSACYYAKQKCVDMKTTDSKKRYQPLENLCDFFVKYQVETEMQIMGLHSSFSFESITNQKLYQSKKFFEHFSKISEKVEIGK